MWQFIPSTGKLYGLHKDCWVDQRRDFVQSTKAAISYFKKLYNQFGDWHLAIASYNCGENSICRAMARSSEKNYWSLTRLPKETRHYVPEFLAALIVAKNPNYAPGGESISDTFNFDTVTIEKCVSLYAIADSLAMPYEQLRQINPHLLHWCTHPREPVTLYVPKGKRDSLCAMLQRTPSKFTVEWYAYRIKSGETLKGLARRFKVSLEAILSLNNLSASRRLCVGREISIPIPVNQTASRAGVIRDRDPRPAPSYKTAIVNGARVVKYRVRGGDCLGEIARLFRVDKNDLTRWNGLGVSAVIRAGTILTLYKTPESLKSVFSPDADNTPAVARTQFRAASAVSTPAAAPTDSIAAVKAAQGVFATDSCAHRIVYYKVRKGDNLWNIAQSFNVPVRELTAINDIDIDTTLFPGLVLKVPLTQKL